MDLFKTAAADTHGRVRLEAITAASWMEPELGLQVLEIAEQHPLDDWMKDSYNFSKTRLANVFLPESKKEVLATHLKGTDLETFAKGKKIYEREGYCVTCHQESGAGLQAASFPTLVGQDWVMGSEERLIKLTLNGLYGPMSVMGHQYDGQVPMMAFRGLLNDEEIAQVLTYVRNAFGNKASVIRPEKVKEIRDATKDKEGFYTPKELLEQYPLKK